METKKFIDGLYVKKPNEKAPEWVKAKIAIRVEMFTNVLQEISKNGWVNIDILENKKGEYYAKIDDYVPGSKHQDEPVDAQRSKEEQDFINSIPF